MPVLASMRAFTALVVAFLMHRGALAFTESPTPSPTRYCYTNMCGLTTIVNKVGVWGGAITTWIDEEHEKISALMDELYEAEAEEETYYYYYEYADKSAKAKSLSKKQEKNKIATVQLKKTLKQAIERFAQGEHLASFRTSTAQKTTTTLAEETSPEPSSAHQDKIESRGLSIGQLSLLGSVALIAGVLSKHMSK